MAEYFGIVTIDGVNVKEIGLHDLRSRMSIIPQVYSTIVYAINWNARGHYDAAGLFSSLPGSSSLQWNCTV